MRLFPSFLILLIFNISMVHANDFEPEDKSGWQLSLGLGFHNLSFDEN